MAKDVLFSEWLNEQMRRKQLSQAQLARDAGISPSTVHKLLNSKIKRPSLETCQGIAKALDISSKTAYWAAKLPLTEPEFLEFEDLKTVVAQLSDQDREEILAIARVKLEIKRKGYATIK